VQENLETLIRDIAKLKGMTVRKVPWAQAHRAKMRDRRRDEREIARGLATPQEVNLRNAGGLGCGRLVVINDSGAYL